MAQKRKGLTLDLNAANSSNKKSKLVSAPHILTSPDVQKLALSTPEMAEFLARTSTLATPTPSGNYTFPRSVTEEQERYVQGFEVALNNLHSNVKAENNTAIETIERATAAHAASTASNNRLSSPRPSSSASGSMDSSDLRIKEEMDDDSDENSEDDDFSEDEIKPSNSKRGRSRKMNLNPIDMKDQEKIKLERKRMRNRLAASKCRKRKLERIAQLDDKVKELKGENVELANVVKRLKETVYNLKQEVIEHVNSGCEINMGNEVNFS